MAAPVAIAREGRSLDPSRADWALAAGLAAFAQLEVWVADAYRGSAAGNAGFMLVMSLALAWRRRAPLAVLALVMAGVAAQAILLGGSETGSLLLVAAIAVYSAGAHSSRPVVGLALALAGALGHDLNDPEIDSVVERLFSPGVFALAFGFGAAMRVRQRRIEAAESRAAVAEAEREREREAAADERRRIARELHDIVSHGLGVMVIQAGAAEQVLDTDPARAREALRLIRETGQDAVDEMARMLGLIRDERPSGLQPQPLLADVEALVATARATGLELNLVWEGERRRLPAGLELSAYRIVQEGLTNVLRHAGASRARVVVRYGSDTLGLRVEDDGVGRGSGAGGYGLAGLRERVAVFGGRLDAGPRPSGGWALDATLPVAR